MTKSKNEELVIYKSDWQWHVNGFLHITKLSIKEVWSKKLAVLLFAFGVLFLAFYLFGIFKLEQHLDIRALDAGLDGRSVTGVANIPIMLATSFGMYLVYFLCSLMSILSVVSAVSGDFENGVIQSILARPTSRQSFLWGRWFGFWIMNFLYLALLSIGLLGGVYIITGFFPQEALISFGLLAIIVTLLTSLTILGSALFSTLANGIAILVLYGLGFAGGILNFIGAFSDVQVLKFFGLAADIMMPSNALWLGASYHLQSDILRQASDFALENPFIGAAPVSPFLLVWSLVFSMLALCLATWRICVRDV